MSAKRPALGRGLDTLLAPSRSEAKEGARTGLRQVPIDRISPNPFQPRSAFDPEKIRELADSIAQKGILQPVLLRNRGEDYELVAGERRWRAAQMAGLREIPAVLRDLTDREMLEAAVIENVQRDDLNPVEEARSYQRLTSEFAMTQDELAKAIGKSRVAVTNALRLLRLPAEVLEMIENGQISAGHGRALLSLDAAAQQSALAKDIAHRGLSVRDVEQRVKQALSRPTKPRTRPENPADLAELEERLCAHLGLRVRLRPRSANAGTLQVLYESLDEFQALCEKFGLQLDESL